MLGRKFFAELLVGRMAKPCAVWKTLIRSFSSWRKMVVSFEPKWRAGWSRGCLVIRSSFVSCQHFLFDIPIRCFLYVRLKLLLLTGYAEESSTRKCQSPALSHVPHQSQPCLLCQLTLRTLLHVASSAGLALLPTQLVKG